MAAGTIDILIRAAQVVAGALVLPALAERRTLYKSVLPDGRVVYADTTQPNARRADALSVEPHPPDAQATAAALRDLALSRNVCCETPMRRSTSCTAR